MADKVLEVQVGAQGRVVLPAALRRALGIGTGDRLVVRQEGERIVMEKREAALARLRTRFSGVPRDVSLVDELIRERRAEAAREAGRR